MTLRMVDSRTGNVYGGAISEELLDQRARGITLFVASYFDGAEWRMYPRWGPHMRNGGAEVGIYDCFMREDDGS